jgi:hypothetical protein
MDQGTNCKKISASFYTNITNITDKRHHSFSKTLRGPPSRRILVLHGPCGGSLRLAPSPLRLALELSQPLTEVTKYLSAFVHTLDAGTIFLLKQSPQLEKQVPTQHHHQQITTRKTVHELGPCGISPRIPLSKCTTPTPRADFSAEGL